jgi:hypothetical protein
MHHKVGIVVPTMGTRPELLDTCLQSIRKSGDCYICVVAPYEANIKDHINGELWDSIVDDEGIGLAGAINTGLSALPNNVEYCNWIGDDDLLEPNSLDYLKKNLDDFPATVLIYGNCIYIDKDGNELWKNSFGKIAKHVLRVGPCLIPQPGSLFRRSAFEDAGGLNTCFGWAFDYDLFIRLSKIGKITYINMDTASFRWHAESLTVSKRLKSVQEASKVRKSHYPRLVRVVSVAWEPIIKIATLHAPRIFKS